MTNIEDKIACLDTVIHSSTENILNFLNSTTEYKESLSTLKEKYNDEFNIFMSISDQYRKENLHSDILKLIFNPNPNPNPDGIGNPEYIKIFIDYIEKRLKKKIDLNYQTIKIEREKDRIDLLISDDKKNCLLIENKINNANDRENQIGNYYKNLKEKDYNIQAVVYIKLSPEKVFLKDYSIEDSKLRDEITNEKLVEISIVNYNNEDCFVNDVIDKCIDISKSTNNIVSTVYLSHYSHLLKILGGKFMTNERKVKNLYKIYSNENFLASFRIIGDLWTDQEVDHNIGNVFKDYFEKELKFESHPVEKETTVYKTIKDGINIGFCNDCAFGFVYSPNKIKIFSSNKTKFKELLKNEKLQRYFTENEFKNDPKWVYKYVDNNKINSLADLKTMVDELEKLLK